MSDNITPLLPERHIRCPGCYSWQKTSHMVRIPAGLIDDSAFTVCLLCAVTIRHAFTVRTEKTVRDVARIVGNMGVYAELGEGAK